MKKEKISQYDIEELASHMVGLKEMPDDTSEIDAAINEKYGVDIDTYKDIVSDLFDKIGMGISPLTETPYIGFTDSKIWLAKKDFTHEFISSVLNWMGAEELTPEDKGMEREITNEAGDIEYILTIKKCQK